MKKDINLIFDIDLESSQVKNDAYNDIDYNEMNYEG